MDILFIGGLYSEKVESEYKLSINGNLQAAANRVQSELINGFKKSYNVNFKVLSAPFIGSFPNASSILYFSKTEEEFNGVNIEYISFINVWGVRNFFRKNSLQKSLKEFINLKSDKKIIFIYSVHTPLLQAAIYAKKKDPSIKLCMYIPDLPQYMNLSDNISLVYKVAKKYDIKVFNSLIKHIDSFIFITKYMHQMIPMLHQPWMVIEGIAPSKVEESKYESEYDLSNLGLNNSTKKIVYTGSLNYIFGIKNLINAFLELENKDIELIICGSGEAEEYILQNAENDARIKFLGKISGEEAIFLQENASILVNPRENNDEYTKYSFPSKIMEYLSSGNPVVCYRLDGIPNEYDQYLNYVDSRGLKVKLEEILNLREDDRKKIGFEAKQFVNNEKNNIVMVERILRFLERTFN